jgi:hypothetical protein
MKLVVVPRGCAAVPFCLWRAMACSTTYFTTRRRPADETRDPAG